MDKILKLVCGLLNYASFHISKFYIDPCPSEGPIKSLLSVCLSLCPSVSPSFVSVFFSEMGCYFFLIFCMMVDDCNI